MQLGDLASDQSSSQGSRFPLQTAVLNAQPTMTRAAKRPTIRRGSGGAGDARTLARVEPERELTRRAVAPGRDLIACGFAE